MEIIGKVTNELSVKVMATTDLGENIGELSSRLVDLRVGTMAAWDRAMVLPHVVVLWLARLLR